MRFVWPLLALAWVSFLYFGVGSLPPLGRILDLHSGLWSHRPQHLVDIELPGLKNPVHIAWDKNGVPHFFGDNFPDLIRAQGYVMASQRLFQMDLSTRQAMGRLSEWVGDKTLEMDRFQILFGMRQSIASTLEKFEKDPADKEMLQAFTEGINTYIRTHGNALPPEYVLLGIKPEPFTPARVIAMDKVLTFSLAGRSFAPALTKLQQKWGAERVLDLFPEFLPPRYEDYIVPDRSGPRRRAEAASDFPFISHLEKIPSFPLPNPGKGSNNWAVAGDHSSTGASLFANDTHLNYSLPNIWFESQMSSPQFNVYGVSLVGIPGFVNGYNGHVAWGPTNGTTSVLDWYEVEFENETSTRYRIGEGWRDAEVYREILARKGAPSQFLDVVWTIHGPVLYREGRLGLAANWMGHRPGQELTAIRGFLTMKDTKECLQNFHDNWSVPIQNFICADQDHVELLHAGRVPKRRIGEGRFIMDGREEHDSLAETIPDKEHPHATPGRDGFILSANQKIEGPNYPYYLGWDYEEAYRGLMIRRRLREKPKLSPEDMLRIQNDDYDPQAELALKWMLQALKRDGLSAEQKRAAEDLGKWDFHVLAGKHEPALFKAWFYAFRGKVADGAMPKELRVTWLLERLSQNPEDSDRQWLKGSLSDVVTEAYREAFASVGSKSWAEYNQAQLPHVARLPGWGSPVLQMDGSGQSIRGNHGRHGPVYKAVFAFGDPMRIWMQVPGGNEGDPLNPDYGRFAQDWAAGQMREVEYDKTWDEAKGKAVRTVTLRPAGG